MVSRTSTLLASRRRQMPLAWKIWILSLTALWATSRTVIRAAAFGARWTSSSSKTKNNNNPSSFVATKIAGSPPTASYHIDDLSSSGPNNNNNKRSNNRQRRFSRRRRIKANERVVFFPTAASRSEDGTSWDIPIHGWIYEPETRDPARRAFVTSLRKYLKLKRDSPETQILKRRVGPFLVDNERRKELSVQIGGGCKDPAVMDSAEDQAATLASLQDNEEDDDSEQQQAEEDCSVCAPSSNHHNGVAKQGDDFCRIFPLPKSGKNGHFEAILTIQDEELEAICASCNNDAVISGCEDHSDGAKLKYQAVMEEHDDRVFEGVAHLIPATGISVISDIDDTVKITGVGNKRALLRSTFMEEFKQVPGMAELYQEWAHELGAKFHFVSSSPWQLWEELETFLSRVGFPQATYHLKPIRLKDRTLFDLWKCPLETKIHVIESILDAFPKRKFLLVGDSGEKDPEVYGEVARRHPEQIKGIYVRNVTNETGTEERYDAAFEGVNPKIWALFTDPQEVATAPVWLKEKQDSPTNAVKP